MRGKGRKRASELEKHIWAVGGLVEGRSEPGRGRGWIRKQSGGLEVGRG